MLKLEAVQFGYGAAPVLRGVSLALSAGEVVSLLGPNGSGKSTLLRVVMGHLRGQGRVDWEGRPLAGWRPRELARRVAYLPQSPMVQGQHTVGDVIRLGRSAYLGAFGIESAEDLRVVNEVAGRLDLVELLNRRMDEVSGGQRQRVFLARCLAQQPRALLLDEPATFLDLRHQVELCRLLRGLARGQGIAVLMASHELNLAAMFSDRMVLLEEGRVRADGRPDEVLRPELLERVYGVPMRRYEGPGGQAIVVPFVDQPEG